MVFPQPCKMWPWLLPQVLLVLAQCAVAWREQVVAPALTPNAPSRGSNGGNTSQAWTWIFASNASLADPSSGMVEAWGFPPRARLFLSPIRMVLWLATPVHAVTCRCLDKNHCLVFGSCFAISLSRAWPVTPPNSMLTSSRVPAFGLQRYRHILIEVDSRMSTPAASTYLALADYAT